MQVRVISDTSPEPISLATAKAWLKVDEALTSEDELITICLTAAREHCERYSGLSFKPKTFEAILPYSGYHYKELPYGPNIVIANVVNNDGLVIVSDAELGSTWLAEYLKGMSINNTYKEDYWSFGHFHYCPMDFLDTYKYTVTYTAGYTTLSSNLKMAVLKMTAELYENRENSVIGTIVAELPTGVKQLLDLEKPNVLFV